MNKSIIKVAGIEIDDLDRKQVLDRLGRAVIHRAQLGELVVTPNLDHLTKVLNDQLFREVYQKATMTIADGFPIRWLSFFKLNTPLKEVIPGSEFTIELFEYINRELPEDRVCKIFILGADDETVCLVKQKFEQKFPRLKVVGAFTGRVTLDESFPRLGCDLSDKILDCEVDLVVGSLGAPKQEMICSFLHAKNPLVTFLCVGATLEFFVGVKTRAPFILRKIKLEWLYRWVKEPSRLTKRYLLCVLTLIKLIFFKWERV